MNTPLRIELDGHVQTMTLHWAKGVTQRVPARLLREMCPCAECRRLRLNGHVPNVQADIAVLDIRPAGYGMQLSFSDGHERGIYPWAFVEQLRTT